MQKVNMKHSEEDVVAKLEVVVEEGVEVEAEVVMMLW